MTHLPGRHTRRRKPHRKGKSGVCRMRLCEPVRRSPAPSAAAARALPGGRVGALGGGRARMLAARGERVLGCDSGHPAEAEGLAEAGVEVSLDVDGTALLDEVEDGGQEPRRAPGGAVVAAARERGIEVIGRAGARLAGPARTPSSRSPAPTARRRRPSCSGHLHREAGEPVAVAGNVGHARRGAGRRARRRTRRSSASARASSSRTPRRFAPECAVLLNLAPDHLDRHGDDGAPTWTRSCGSSRTRATTTSAIYNGATPELRGRDLGGCARRIRFCPAEAPEGAPTPTAS